MGKALKVCSTAFCTQHSGMASEPEKGVAKCPVKDSWPGHKGESLSSGLQRRTCVGSADCLWPSLPGQLCCHVFCTVSAAVFVPCVVSISSLGSAPASSSGDPAQLAALLMLYSSEH